jgi:transcriptional regulator with XRE-family HTH domain
METLKQSFGRRVRALREAHSHSREYLSQYVDLDPQSLYRVEKGDQFIAPEKLDKLAKFYNVSPARFFQDEPVSADLTTLRLSLIADLAALDDAKLEALGPVFRRMLDEALGPALDSDQDQDKTGN